MKPHDFTERQIMAITEQALKDAGVLGHLPTPLHAIAEVAGLSEIVDVADLPAELERAKPRAWKAILGAILFPARVAFVDRSQVETRVRFTEAHEVVHKLLPWHERSYLLDDDTRLSHQTDEQLEVEANLGAAHLLFQGRRFHERALDYERSLRTPLLLAETHGASRHAGIRYYVEHHPEPVALAVTGIYERVRGLPVWYVVESPAFRAQYGSLDRHLPAVGCIPVERGGGFEPYSSLLRDARSVREVVDDAVELADRDGVAHKFKAEAFCNSRNVFLMLSRRRRLPLGRSVRLVG